MEQALDANGTAINPGDWVIYDNTYYEVGEVRLFEDSAKVFFARTNMSGKEPTDCALPEFEDSLYSVLLGYMAYPVGSDTLEQAHTDVDAAYNDQPVG